MAHVLDAAHPTLVGRVRIRCASTGDAGWEGWVPTLQHLAVRAGDRVLVVTPGNGDEPVVIGVVDGFRRRELSPGHVAATLSLLADECVQVSAHDGTPLVQVRRGPDGPVVRLCSDDVLLEVPGRLALRADALLLQATTGQVCIEATDDVVVRGEIIRLN